MTFISITIPMRPITKDNDKSYDPRTGKFFKARRFAAFETACRLHALSQYKGKPLEGRLVVRMNFYFTDNKMPDLFNLPKSVADAMNGVLWGDDRQIVNGILSKSVGVRNEIHVIVERRQDNDNPKI